MVAASGTSRRRPLGAAAPARERGDGVDVAVQGGRRHQHTPEIEQALTAAAGTDVTLSFTPVLAPMPRGILATMHRPARRDAPRRSCATALHAAYDDEPFVHVLPDGQLAGHRRHGRQQRVHLQVAADSHSGRAVVVAALDNLVKGAAGQAVQNANLVLGLDETAGLPVDGTAP